jgi:hypothetical protein
MSKSPKLRECINAKCKSCIYDPEAAGTWRQQVTICSVTECPLYPVRPRSRSAIPSKVLDYYLVEGSERAFYGCSRPLEGPFIEPNAVEE